MHHNRDEHGRPPRHEDHGAREHEEEPVFTTLAVGEEGDPDLRPDPVGLPEEPVFTTLAVGEEGGDLEPEWSVATTQAVGEEGCPDFGEGFATTAAIGEEGDPGLDPWGA